MLTVYMSADIEGTAGLVSPNHASSDHGEHERFRRLMTLEVNSAVAGAFAAGASRVVVNDSHGTMSNILIEELDQRADLISGSPKPLGMMEGMGPEVDVVFLTGCHAASGVGRAVLEHTNNKVIHSLYVGGRLVGEIGMNAYLAAHYGKPVILVTGDRAAVEEARELLGAIETVATKEGITRTSAVCRTPESIRAQIREAAERAVRTRKDGGQRLAVPEEPTLQVVFQRCSHADMAELLPGAVRVDGRTVFLSAGQMVELYRAYRAMLALAKTVE